MRQDNLDEFGQKGIYADYLIGELHCEQPDLDSEGDIATSSRQSLKQYDPRFEALRAIVLAELRNIAGRWSEWRRSDEAKVAATVPAVSDWLGQLKGDTKKEAERWIGRLNTIRSNDEGERKELLKASILAFESYRRKEELDRLDGLKDESIEHILEIFKNIDDLELSYYGEIVKLRTGVIRMLQDKLKKNDKELVLRDYISIIFRCSIRLGSGERQRTRRDARSEVPRRQYCDAGKAKTGRIDIRYRTTRTGRSRVTKTDFFDSLCFQKHPNLSFTLHFVTSAFIL